MTFLNLSGVRRLPLIRSFMWALPFGILILLSCRPVSAQSYGPLEYRVDRHIVRFEGEQTLVVIGPTTTELAQEVREIENDRIRTIRITSLGGDRGGAIALAKLVYENQWNVVVSGFCASGCAHYILAASPHVTLENDAFVLFHHSGAAIKAMLGSENASLLPASYFSDEAWVLQLYRERGIDERLLLAPFAALEPRCYFWVSTPAETPEDVRFFTEGQGWSASASVLASYGLRIYGDSPDSHAELMRRIRLSMLLLLDDRIIFAMARDEAREALSIRQVAATPECDPATQVRVHDNAH
jgi:hypothetical protein